MYIYISCDTATSLFSVMPTAKNVIGKAHVMLCPVKMHLISKLPKLKLPTCFKLSSRGSTTCAGALPLSSACHTFWSRPYDMEARPGPRFARSCVLCSWNLTFLALVGFCGLDGGCHLYQGAIGRENKRGKPEIGWLPFA